MTVYNICKGVFFIDLTDCPGLKHTVGEGTCDEDVNIPECNYDGGDCCGPNVKCFSEYSVCECKEEGENSQNTNTEDPNYIFPNVRSDCNTCNCGYVKDASIEFIECHESQRYICEYKGGPSCPDGMFSLYGNCLGFVKNIMDDNTANDKTCHFQSGAVHNYKLAQIDDIQVNTKNSRPHHVIYYLLS